MTSRKMFVLGAAAAALALSAVMVAPALARPAIQSASQKAAVDAAKAAGTVGEQADGYVGVRTTASAELRAAVEAINAGRRALYARTAAETGVSVDVAGARMFEGQLLARIPAGQWYRNASGQWVQR
jgi:uncharacterized protein YdbL (DUF1318 family)